MLCRRRIFTLRSRRLTAGAPPRVQNEYENPLPEVFASPSATQIEFENPCSQVSLPDDSRVRVEHIEMEMASERNQEHNSTPIYALCTQKESMNDDPTAEVDADDAKEKLDDADGLAEQNTQPP